MIDSIADKFFDLRIMIHISCQLNWTGLELRKLNTLMPLAITMLRGKVSTADASRNKLVIKKSEPAIHLYFYSKACLTRNVDLPLLGWQLMNFILLIIYLYFCYFSIKQFFGHSSSLI